MLDVSIMEENRQHQNMRLYYRFHALVYDASRWSFLFGRDEALHLFPIERFQHPHLLEAGCGTGRNIKQLARIFPYARFTGVDVSPHMLRQAKKALRNIPERVNWEQQAYAPGTFYLDAPADGILFSYALTMFNPGWEAALDRAVADLAPGGYIVVVDFHQTGSGLFRWWMQQNHVRMDGHLLPALRQRFRKVHESVHPAFGGLWQYFMFIGQKNPV